jgi:hypothetical protein
VGVQQSDAVGSLIASCCSAAGILFVCKIFVDKGLLSGYDLRSEIRHAGRGSVKEKC